MKLQAWLRIVLLAACFVALAWGVGELARAFGRLPGGAPVALELRVDLARLAWGTAACALGLAGVLTLPASLLTSWLGRTVRLLGGPLQTERQSDGCRLLLRDLEVEIGEVRVRVPRGTRTDYSSIPSLGRALVRWSRVDVAGVVHDWLYQQGPPDWTRAEADRIWRDVALAGEHRANPLQAWVGWLALRAFGHLAWRGHRRNAAKTCDAGSQPADEGS